MGPGIPEAPGGKNKPASGAGLSACAARELSRHRRGGADHSGNAQGRGHGRNVARLISTGQVRTGWRKGSGVRRCSRVVTSVSLFAVDSRSGNRCDRSNHEVHRDARWRQGRRLLDGRHLCVAELGRCASGNLDAIDCAVPLDRDRCRTPAGRQWHGMSGGIRGIAFLLDANVSQPSRYDFVHLSGIVGEITVAQSGDRVDGRTVNLNLHVSVRLRCRTRCEERACEEQGRYPSHAAMLWGGRRSCQYDGDVVLRSVWNANANRCG